MDDFLRSGEARRADTSWGLWIEGAENEGAVHGLGLLDGLLHAEAEAGGIGDLNFTWHLKPQKFHRGGAEIAKKT